MAKYGMGWRPSLPDRRDKLYTVPRSVLQSLPPAADLQVNMGRVLNQESLGRCGPTSAASLVMFDKIVQGLPVTDMSCLFTYWFTRYLMNTVNSDSGVDNRTMLRAMNQFGECDESLCRDNNATFTVKPSAAAIAAAAKNKITDYASVAQTSQQMKGCLASGKPFLFGFTVYESFESPAVEQTGIVPLPKPGESVLGGHDVCICGYDDAKGRFKFKNSWSDQWGAGGYGWFPYEYCLSADLSGDFWVINTIPGGVIPKPTPTPTPTPTPVPVTGTKTFSFPYDLTTGTAGPVTVS